MTLRENVRFVWQRLTGATATCPHAAEIRIHEPIEAHACPECVASGDRWRALRACVICGQIGCCDSSKNRHARRHFERTGHPIIRSAQPGEGWMWCFVDARLIEPRTGGGG
jgi:uncharacterized UBP type Zn finger protein